MEITKNKAHQDLFFFFNPTDLFYLLIEEMDDLIVLDCSCWMESLSWYEVLAGDLLEHALQLHKVGIETLKNRR